MLRVETPEGRAQPREASSSGSECARGPGVLRMIRSQFTAQSRQMSVFCKMLAVQKTVTWFDRDDAQTQVPI